MAGNVLDSSPSIARGTRARGRGGRGRSRGAHRVSFEALNSNLTASFVKFPHNLDEYTLRSIHAHIKNNITPLINLTKEKFQELIINFENQSSLLIASVLHNYSPVNLIGQVELGNVESFNNLFNEIALFESQNSFNFIPNK